jgi:hypothetical protein
MDADNPLSIIGGLPDLLTAQLESIAARVLEAVARHDPVGATALTFLLREYGVTDRADLGDALGGALAAALALAPDEATVVGRAGWVVLFTEVTLLTDDDRVMATAAALIGSLRDEWPSALNVAEAAVSVDACLRAAFSAGIVDPQDLVPAAIDQLERIVGGAYQPGGGMAHTFGVARGVEPGARVQGDRADHVRPAAALLTAFELSARLPYSMLAEELIQVGRREPWDEDLLVNCDAARVLCRLAALHADKDYQRAAVIAADVDYRADASRMLDAQAARALGRDRATLDESAAYGLALREWLGLQSQIL